MSRYIDADDALEVLNLMYDNQADKDDPYNVGVMGATNYIKHRAPSLEIIRCGECKHYKLNGACMRLDRKMLAVRPNDFCSYGEREGE